MQSIQMLNSLEGNHSEEILLLCNHFYKTTRSELINIPINYQEILNKYIHSINFEDACDLAQAYNIVTNQVSKRLVPCQDLLELQVLILKNIGLLYQKQKKLVQSIKTFKYVVKIEQNLSEILQARLILTSLYSQISQHSDAINQLNKVSMNIHKIEDIQLQKKVSCIMYYNFGIEYQHLHRFQLAQQQFKLADQIAEDQKLQDLQQMIKQYIK